VIWISLNLTDRVSEMQKTLFRLCTKAHISSRSSHLSCWWNTNELK